MTLVINGTLAGPLLKKLGLAEDTTMRRRIVQKYKAAYKEKVLDDYVHLLMDPVYQKTDFIIVRQHIPEFADVNESDLREAMARNKARTPSVLYRKPNLSNAFKVLNDENSKKEGAGGESGDKVLLPDDSGSSDNNDGVEEPSQEGETSQRDTNIIPTNKGSSSIVSTPKEEVDLAIEFRKVFVELLKAAYQKLIENGELDGREGFATYALLEGIDFTNDAIQNGKTLKDWEVTMQSLNSWTEPMDRYITRMLRHITSAHTSHERRKNVFHHAKQLNPEHEQSLGLVKMCIGFIRAHEIAEKLFKKEMGIMGAPKTEALILEESQAQMKLAKEAFEGQDNTTIVVSHIASVILINKAARYVDFDPFPFVVYRVPFLLLSKP